MKPPADSLSIARPVITRRFVAWAAAVSAAATVGTMSAAGVLNLRPPRLELIAAAPPQVAIHVAAAGLALAIGLVLLAGVKGTRAHRVLGWTWVAAMTTVAVSSLFIREINPGHFSWIHLLTGWSLVALPGAVWAARRQRRLHARAMTGLFVGGLVVAGAFTFVPGRLMWAVFFG